MKPALAIVAGLVALLAVWFSPTPNNAEPLFGGITASSTTYATAGTYTYKVSTNACSVIVDAWGGGGSGFDGTTAGGGAGGGGGAFASSTITVTPGTNITIVVGAGGVGSAADGATTTFNGTVVVASPGGGGKSATTGRGLAGSSVLSTGTTKNAGGAGGAGNGTDDAGGGGGGAGGPHGVGGAGADASTTAGGGGGEGDGGAAGSGTTGGTGGPGGDGGNGGNGGVCTAGGSAATGGGGSGGADNGGTACTAGAPGGGGGGAEITGPWNGAAGQIKLTEFVDSAGCSNPPTVTTQSATAVTASTATANGDITSTGSSNVTVRGFAWGTSATMAGDTATTSDTAGQPFSTGAFTGSLTSLIGNTTYYTRAYATNTSGDGLGAISASFLTIPGAPTSLVFTNILTTSLTAGWTAPTGGVATYNLQRCQTGTQSCLLTTGIAATSQAVSSLTSGVSYDFAVQGVNATGSGAWTATSSVTTLIPTTIRNRSGTIRINSGTVLMR